MSTSIWLINQVELTLNKFIISLVSNTFENANFHLDKEVEIYGNSWLVKGHPGRIIN